MSLLKWNKQSIIYISHVKQEALQAKALRKDLTKLGYRVFSTPQDKSMQAINNVMQRVMHRMDAVVTLTSPAALRSARIWTDQAYARMHNVPVIPMVVQPLETDIPLLNHIDAIDNLEDGLAHLQKALQRKRQYKNNVMPTHEISTKSKSTTGQRILTKMVAALTSVVR